MIMIRKLMESRLSNLQGGKGEVILQNVVTEEELNGHATLYAKVILPPGSSIGVHQHVGNTEPYMILSGKGLFTDNDGSTAQVEPGDVCVIKVGQSHGIANPYDEDLVFMALIYNE